MVCGILSICGIIIYTNRRKDLMCLRSEYTVEIGRCVMLDVIFPNARREGISVSLGISGKTLLSTTRLDAMTYGLHCNRPTSDAPVKLYVLPPADGTLLSRSCTANGRRFRCCWVGVAHPAMTCSC
jgi:hypothetical protein